MTIQNRPKAMFVEVGLAPPEVVKAWCERILPTGERVGEVTDSETIHYQTHKPIPDGLFCQRIFGPIKSYECACRLSPVGRQKQPLIEGAKGERYCCFCEVEITRSSVRRYRMGHIKLKTALIHPWFMQENPCHIALALNMKHKLIINLAYFSLAVSYINPRSLQCLALKRRALFTPNQVAILFVYMGRDASSQIRHKEIGFGSETLIERLESLNLKQVIRQGVSLWQVAYEEFVVYTKKPELVEKKKSIALLKKGARRKRQLTRRAIMARKMILHQIRPEWMCFRLLPVLPPDLRPMINLEGEQYISSDLNELYGKVLYRNKMLHQFHFLHKNFGSVPELVEHHSARMLQEAVDVLIKTGVEGKPYPLNSKPLRSFSQVLQGKMGRFRQNLLGKRVDYSARSVIVVGPELAMHQCGMPIEIGLDLFQPFLVRKLIQVELATNMRHAQRLIDEGHSLVFELLRQTVQDHTVLLNRAPTLHRLGIQAFQPMLVVGRAIQLHPLVCAAFNADFDGDQMALHVPLSMAAQAEARFLMLSSFNLLSPAQGEALAVPSQDMLLGLYSMTHKPMPHFTIEEILCGKEKESSDDLFPCFSNGWQVIEAYQQGFIDLYASVWVRFDKTASLTDGFRNEKDEQEANEIHWGAQGGEVRIYQGGLSQKGLWSECANYILTSAGRVLVGLPTRPHSFHSLISTSLPLAQP
uniref:RNA polymerase beta' subunit n=1 Tax=Klebsormidium dissectum TaxID=329816 RepID=UPI00286D4028|nr:RNA polymerase beta' subunit [Klebsormidium dissectum]WKT06470.1 RNA polymerase beta' subunit [Klebsormidium dissectum]